jgi:SAM-dependent methyltransferase
MKELRLLWQDYRYFPYEKMLAERETDLLFGEKSESSDEGLRVEGRRLEAHAASRLTYFKAADDGATLVVPDQAKLEASSSGNGSTWNPKHHPIPSLRRQSTRYSAHGLHEYRGKFNPQVVRAIGNLFGLEPSSRVLDPFCGSGTTLLEAAHIGWNALGIDLNPLGVLIANAKIIAFNSSPATLVRESEALIARLATAAGDDWREWLPEPEYLESWFPAAVLRQMRAILKAIEASRPVALQDVFKVVLSDICREISWQDPGDLRIRRRKDPAQDYPAMQLFVDSLRAKVGAVGRARQHVRPRKGVTQRAVLGDSRVTDQVVRSLDGPAGAEEFEAAITSPPYATAMPYLDTQRLSLALFGLIPSRELRRGEKEQIGNREIQDRERLELEALLVGNRADLPESAASFCRRLLELADHGSHGFRRKNVPALTYKYLADMASMFATVRAVVRDGGRYGLLVGRNATTLRGEEVLIDTPRLLADLAESRGWSVEEMTPFETYHRFDVHQGNSIREEVLLVLSRV